MNQANLSPDKQNRPAGPSELHTVFSTPVEIEFTGGDIELGLNGRYVQDVFAVIEQEKVIIEMNEILSPTLVRPLGDDGYRCVVMPMRL